MKPVSTLLALLAGLALFVSGAQAAQNAWTVTGPNGGRTWGVAYHPTQPGVLLISTSRGMYHSTDGGQHWILSAGGASSMVDFAFDPSNPSRVFAANNALWRSDDGGQSFATVAGVPTSGVRLLGFGGAGQLFVVDGDSEVYHTSDQGQHWTHATRAWPATPGTQMISSLGVDPNTPGTVYVGVQGYGIYKSSNSGVTWSTPAPGPGTSSYTTNTIAVKLGNSSRVLVAANDGVYRSINGGTSWTRITTVVAYALTINPDVVNTDEVMAVTDFDNHVIRSTDGGATFPFAGAILNRLGTNRMAFDPHGPGRVMVTSDDGPLLSIDDGDNFEVLDDGIHSESSARFSASDDGTIYSIFGNGPNHVYMRDALGWHALDPTSLRARIFIAPWLREIETAPLDSDVVYVVPRMDHLLKSVDGGTTWTGPDLHFAGQGREVARVVVDPTATNVVYVTTTLQGVWRSANGGTSWAPRSTGLPAAIGPLTVDRASPNVLYAGGSDFTTGGVYKSTNSGMTWSATGTLPAQSVFDIVIDPANSEIVYAVTSNQLYRSTNGGTNWSRIDFGDVSPQAVQSRGLFIDPVLPSTLIFSSALFSGGFMRSVDSGATWENIPWPQGLNYAGVVAAAAVDPLRPSSVITNGYGTGVLEYEVAPDLALEVTGIVPPLATETSVTGTLTVRNLGPNASSNAVATVVLPSWLTVAVPSGCSLSVHTLTCTTGPIRRNQVTTFPLALTVAATPSTGQITATLSSHEPDPVSSNNTRIVALTSTLQNSFELGITTPTTVVDHGDRVRFTLTGRNAGPSPANDTRIVLPLGQFELVSINTSGGSPTCSINGTMVITCTYQRIDAGATVTVTVAADADFIGSNPMDATMTGEGDTATAGVGITARPVADFSVAIQGPPGPITVGASYQYSMTIRNNGPDAAQVGASAFFDLASTSGVTVNGVTCSRFAVSLECFTPSLAVNATATIVVDVVAAGPGTATASVTLHPGGADRVSTNDAASVTITQRLVGNASVTLAESADPVTTNTPFRYTANVRNAGPNEGIIRLSVPVTGATITGGIGPALAICVTTTQLLSCEMRVASGASADVFIDVSAASAGTVNATATVEFEGFDSDTTNNSATLSTAAIAPPPPPPPPGGGSSSSGGGGGGGGRFDWLALLLLGGLVLGRSGGAGSRFSRLAARNFASN